MAMSSGLEVSLRPRFCQRAVRRAVGSTAFGKWQCRLHCRVRVRRTDCLDTALEDAFPFAGDELRDTNISLSAIFILS